MPTQERIMPAEDRIVTADNWVMRAERWVMSERDERIVGQSPLPAGLLLLLLLKRRVDWDRRIQSTKPR